MSIPKKLFKYRSFNIRTLSSLCRDTLYFSHPAAFNDPLDCHPTINCDSTNEELQRLLAFFVGKRVTSKMYVDLCKARITGDAAKAYANKQAATEAQRILFEVADKSTDCEYGTSVEENESWILIQAIESEIRQWYERGICCFSTSYSNPLLWSHYGDQHKGLCIGYTTERDPVPELKKTVYGGSRSINSSTLCEAFLNENGSAAAEVDRDVLLRKAKGWKYESEWRLIGQQGLQTSPLRLAEVTFGFRCTGAVKYAVVQALDGRDVEVTFYEMYDKRNSFRLSRRRVEVDELKTCFPVTARSAVEMGL
jgi:hypothetical protein